MNYAIGEAIEKVVCSGLHRVTVNYSIINLDLLLFTSETCNFKHSDEVGSYYTIQSQNWYLSNSKM